VPLQATGSVTLETHNGTIHVHTWDRPEIEIHARIEAASSDSEDMRRFDQTTVEIDSTSGSVRIKSKYPDYQWSWFDHGSNPQIHYTITSPRTARWTVHDHNSKAEIRDLNAALTLDTHNGTLRALNLGGPLEVDAHNGNIEVEFASFHGANLSMHNGSAELSLPSNSRFDLRTSVHHADVQSDFPLYTRTFGRRDRSVEGSVNGGGPTLRFDSHNGLLRLRSR
jgi:DUF4097 and DUF4098 domain-containing protein YvlB